MCSKTIKYWLHVVNLHRRHPLQRVSFNHPRNRFAWRQKLQNWTLQQNKELSDDFRFAFHNNSSEKSTIQSPILPFSFPSKSVASLLVVEKNLS